MYDALRMEITNTSASPATTGWDDYTYINGNTQVAPVDSVGLPASFSIVPEPSSVAVMALGSILLARRRNRRAI
jgi:hypothetical protein